MGLYIHQFVDISVSTFLAFVNNAVVITYKFLCRHIFLSLGYIPSGGTSLSYGNYA